MTTYAVHPGFVQSELFREVENRCLFKLLVCFMKCIGENYVSVEEGARTSLYCCLEPSLDNETGLYYRYECSTGCDSCKVTTKQKAKIA